MKRFEVAKRALRGNETSVRILDCDAAGNRLAQTFLGGIA